MASISWVVGLIPDEIFVNGHMNFIGILILCICLVNRQILKRATFEKSFTDLHASQTPVAVCLILYLDSSLFQNIFDHSLRNVHAGRVNTVPKFHGVINLVDGQTVLCFEQIERE